MRSLLIVSLVLASSAWSFDFKTRQKTLRQKHSSLYKASLIPLPNGDKRFDKGSLFVRQGLNILSLRGTDFEMAYQHGILLKDQISQGAIPLCSNMVRNNVRQTIGNRPALVALATNVIHKKHTYPLIDYVASSLGDPGVYDDLIGLSEGSQYPLDTILEAFFDFEVLFYLSGTKVNSGGEDVEIIPMASNCSDFVAWDDYTKTGEIIIGRNTDFPVNGYYDHYPTVLYMAPDSGLKHMAIVSAGVQNAGMVSLNEAGLFLGVHTIPTTEVSNKGIPVFLAAQKVIRGARTMDEAIQLFKKYPSPSGWVYTVVSSKERRVATVEMNSKRLSVRESTQGWQVQANYFHTPELEKDNKFINQSIVEDTVARELRMKDLLHLHKGTLDIDSALSILADHTDPLLGEIQGFPNTVSVHTTITSVSVLPESEKIYVGLGRAPVSESSFLELPMPSQFDESTFPTYPTIIKQNDAFKVQYPDKWKAQQMFIQAKMAYENEGDERKALKLMEDILTVDKTNSAYYFIAGILSLRSKAYSSAKKHLTAALGQKNLEHRKRMTQYYLGRLAGFQGQHKEAGAYFAEILASPSIGPKLRTAAQNSADWIAKHPKGKMPLPNAILAVMFQQADMFNYWK